MRILFVLGALAVAGLFVTGAIKLQKTDKSVNIQIDKRQVAEDFENVVEEGKELLREAEAILHDHADR